MKPDGYLYFAIPGMKQDCHDHLPPELLLSWTPEQLEYMHDVAYWQHMISLTDGIEILSVAEMESNEEVWQDWRPEKYERRWGKVPEFHPDRAEKVSLSKESPQMEKECLRHSFSFYA